MVNKPEKRHLDEVARIDEREEEIHIPALYVVQACYMIFKEICRKYGIPEICKVTLPVFIGSIPEKPVLDPLMIKVWGFTSEVVTGGISMEVTKHLDGFAGAPGVID